MRRAPLQVLTVRVSAAFVHDIDELASATGRCRAEIVRFLLSRTGLDALPASWFETAEQERIAKGYSGHSSPAAR